MANDVIIQRIVLDGAPEVGAAFTKIEEAGAKAFEAIKAAAEGVSFTSVIESLGALAVAFAGVTVAVFEWADHAAKATVALDHLATQAGTSIETLSAMKSVLQSLGVDTDGLEASFRRMAV